jgi:hypothetical protein
MAKQKKRPAPPSRRPATQADVLRAKQKGVEDAVRLVQAMVFTVLLDKEGYDEEGLQRVWAELEYLSDSINQGYVNLPDLVHILREEYHLQL